LLKLLSQLNREYLIGATQITPFHSVWKLTAPGQGQGQGQGQAYILKKVKRPPAIFTQLALLINEFHRQGCNALLPILPTRNGELLYLSLDGDYFSLSPWCAGEKPSFSNPAHLKLIAECFAGLHTLSQSQSRSHSHSQLQLGELSAPPELSDSQAISEYQLQQDFLESLPERLTACKNLNRIDRIVASQSTYYLEQGRLILKGLTDLGLSQFPLHNLIGFCHKDPAPGNIILNNRQCYLIDFEFSHFDLVIKEFALLALRALQASRWEPRTLEILTAAYSQVKPFVPIELKMLPFLIAYPRRFWRFCHQRYQEHLKWHEKRYQSRLWEIMDEEPHRSHFIQSVWPDIFPSELKNQEAPDD
jgi:CotS family spore coat protein